MHTNLADKMQIDLPDETLKWIVNGDTQLTY